MSPRNDAILWVVQRASAAVLTLCVAVHLVTVIGAVRGGLSAAEIVGRLQGHTGWLSFYLVFSLAVSVHAPIGLRNVAIETGVGRGRWLDWSLGVLSICLLLLGARAAYALYSVAA